MFSWRDQPADPPRLPRFSEGDTACRRQAAVLRIAAIILALVIGDTATALAESRGGGGHAPSGPSAPSGRYGGGAELLLNRGGLGRGRPPYADRQPTQRPTYGENPPARYGEGPNGGWPGRTPGGWPGRDRPPRYPGPEPRPPPYAGHPGPGWGRPPPYPGPEPGPPPYAGHPRPGWGRPPRHPAPEPGPPATVTVTVPPRAIPLRGRPRFAPQPQPVQQPVLVQRLPPSHRPPAPSRTLVERTPPPTPKPARIVVAPSHPAPPTAKPFRRIQPQGLASRPPAPPAAPPLQPRPQQHPPLGAALAATPPVPDEVLFELGPTTDPSALAVIAQRYRLAVLRSDRITLLNTTIYRMRVLGRGRGLPEVLRALRADGRLASVQVNNRYTLQDDKPAVPTVPAAPVVTVAPAAPVLTITPAAPVVTSAPATPIVPAAPAAPVVTSAPATPVVPAAPTAPAVTVAPAKVFVTAAPAGPATQPPATHSLQWAADKMQLAAAHKITQGGDVLVAMLDSGVDATHPEIAGAKVTLVDLIDAPFKPNVHGTAMAGALLAHARLLGVSPSVHILEIRAFDAKSKAAGAEGTTDHILRGLDAAYVERANIVNLSFAGPADDLLARMLAALRQKGLTVVAAAGNGGALSPPLFPGADPNVIAVTATDQTDALYSDATRGPYIHIAAPGVAILEPAPGGAYQMTSGTSVAAAHVSGIVALMLARNLKLDPGSVQHMLSDTASKLPQTADAGTGSAPGLVNAFGALQILDRKPDNGTAPEVTVTH